MKELVRDICGLVDKMGASFGSCRNVTTNEHAVSCCKICASFAGWQAKRESCQ